MRGQRRPRGTTGTAPPCAPCAGAADCVAGATCGQVGGQLFCAIDCAATSCGTDEVCASVVAAGGTSVQACVPKSNSCAALPSPIANDGGTFTQCGALRGPPIASSCHACEPSASCQPNGCYGGYWCNETTRDCAAPPKTCG